MAENIEEKIIEIKKQYELCPEGSFDRQCLGDYIKKLEIEKGRIDFFNHVLDTCMRNTNRDLAKMNMQDFMFYSNNREQYREDYLEACQILESYLRALMDDIIEDLIKGIMVKI